MTLEPVNPVTLHRRQASALKNTCRSDRGGRSRSVCGTIRWYGRRLLSPQTPSAR